jgi:tRNA modification GTPase
MDTIFALSSGRPPAAIGVVRISGPAAFAAVRAMAGELPPPRRAALRTLRDGDDEVLDRALVLAFPGPATATGEDLAELHLHGGRAVVDAVLRTLGATAGLRPAVAGEFTRRALINGRVDLAQAQGLADLLEAETEGARRAALAASEGVVGRAVRGWLDRLSDVAALVEAALDHADEDDVADDAVERAVAEARGLAGDLSAALARPSVERLRDGALVVIAGPTNAGKSSLFNALLARDAAIVTPIAGTTRDVLEATVVRDGVPYRLVDTAGLARETDDPVEAIGVARADAMVAAADLILWLGEPGQAPERSIRVHARADVVGRETAPSGSLAVSMGDPASVDRLWSLLAARAPAAGWNEAYFHEDQREALRVVKAELDAFALVTDDPLAGAEHLRIAHWALSKLLGVDATEAMLDALFSRFCIGK